MSTDKQLTITVFDNNNSETITGSVKKIEQELRTRIEDQSQWAYVGPTLLSLEDLSVEFLSTVNEDIVVTPSLTGGSI